VLLRCESEDDVHQVSSDLTSFVQAGTESTVKLILWNILHLATFTDVQDKIRQEVFDVLGSTGEYHKDKMKNMLLLKNFIRESHRVTPFIPIVTTRRL